MTLYFVLKYLHVIGASALLGTGAGIAFFMLMAHLSGSVAGVAAVARIVVIADFVFTATAVVAQPITGMALAASAVGRPLPRRYYRLFWLWFTCGFSAFGAVAAIFWLMISRPELAWFSLG